MRALGRPVLPAPPEAVAAEPRSSAVKALSAEERSKRWAIYRVRIQTLLLSLPLRAAAQQRPDGEHVGTDARLSHG
jgi:hypothetical protein